MSRLGEGERPVNFIVLFQGRTGSTQLIDVLQRHPEITADGERLVRFRQVEPWERSEGLLALLKRPFRRRPDVAQLDFTRHFFSRSPRPSRVLGFKTKVIDVLDLLGFEDALAAASARIIVMRRRNLVKQAVSHLNAARLHARTESKYGKQAWNLYDEQDRLGSFEVDPETFDSMLRRVVFDEQLLDAYATFLHGPKLQLEYADLLRDRSGWFERVYAFLDVEPRPAETRVLKATRDDLRRVLSNFDELVARYEGTRFEPMFTEVTTSG